MSRFIRSAVCPVVLSSACTAPAFAAESEKIAAARAPSARSLDCARRYNKAMHIEDTMAAAMKTMMPMMLDQYRVPGQAAQPERERLVLEAIIEASHDMMPKMMDALAPVMATTFTEAEVCGLADFYESAVGQGVVAKMPAFSIASAGVMGEYMPMLQAEMTRRICTKIDCSVAGSPKKAPARAS